MCRTFTAPSASDRNAGIGEHVLAFLCWHCWFLRWFLVIFVLSFFKIFFGILFACLFKTGSQLGWSEPSAILLHQSLEGWDFRCEPVVTRWPMYLFSVQVTFDAEGRKAWLTCTPSWWVLALPG